ncbi:MAG: hypothetical protein LQ348_001369 [Seirophora lacunosa]|nr:MAG: hypothetical protein LQ348_001369 [Seirophora lacunosa]
MEASKQPLDPEKGLGEKHLGNIEIGSDSASSNDALPIPVPEKLSRWNRTIQSLKGFEARGISRVLPHEREEPTLAAMVQMAIMWYSANITLNNLAVGFLGPLLFELGFLDSALIVVFACFVGSIGTAYMAIWGPQSGNRTMVIARYFMGYWPAKLTTVLNLIIMVGYGTISCIIGGQVLSAVSGGTMSVVVGIVIIALICWAIAVFGMKPFHVYEKYQAIPQTLVLFILVGSAGPHFNTSLQSVGNSATIAASRLSFFTLQLSVPLSWAGASSDFFVYYPENTSKRLVFAMTFIGVSVSFIFVNLLAVGLASGVSTNPGWETAYNTSSGALILAGFDGLGGFGKFCAVVVALGLCSNAVPSIYAAALDFQVLGKVWKAIPRYLWATVVAIIYLVCAVAGRDQLFLIFQNFLALMGYWLAIFITIVFEEHMIFRRTKGYDWAAYEDKTKLPLGIAALASFLVGWVGPILGMYQVYWTGPIAARIGDHGGDVGIWLGIAFAAVVFPPLRFFELRQIGR